MRGSMLSIRHTSASAVLLSCTIFVAALTLCCCTDYPFTVTNCGEEYTYTGMLEICLQTIYLLASLCLG